MEANFWHQRWKDNDIAFHQNEANPLLLKHVTKLGLAPGSRVFVPLCGKTLDIAWLLTNGYSVAGAELSPVAIHQLFDELGVVPQITQTDKFTHYSASHLDIFVGDFFDLHSQTLGHVNAIYDRAALVALPEPKRPHYTKHLIDITAKAPQLLISFEYDQSAMPGPPFSVSHEEVRRHYEKSYNLTLLESTPIPGGLKGKCEAKENVWLMR